MSSKHVIPLSFKALHDLKCCVLPVDRIIRISRHSFIRLLTAQLIHSLPFNYAWHARRTQSLRRKQPLVVVIGAFWYHFDLLSTVPLPILYMLNMGRRGVDLYTITCTVCCAIV
jgi:hypothetical protein